MIYPADMTADDIMKFEFEMNRICDIEQNCDFVRINQELAVLSDCNQTVKENVMGGLKDVFISIQEDIELGVLSFQKISEKYNVPMAWVNEAWDDLCQQYEEEDRARMAKDNEYPDADSAYEDRYEYADL
ncbi:MAG: hypothetical protein RLZZ196_1029 [Bacteroidota bacterium]|jgi:hypothetical protein